jgi:HAD superfamily phosphatase (TIGR01681 family)
MPSPLAVVAASFADDAFAAGLEHLLADTVGASVRRLPYGALTGPAPGLSSLPSPTSSPVLLVVLARLEDFAYAHPEERIAEATTAATTAATAGVCLPTTEDAWTVLSRPPPPSAWARGADGLVAAVAALCASVASQPPPAPCLVLLCPSPSACEEDGSYFSAALSSLRARLPAPARLVVLPPSSSHSYDPAADLALHRPYPARALALLALAAARWAYSALRPPPRKVVVLDADNTLWGGVVGEVGPRGIDVSGPYADLQGFMVALQRTGTLLCVCTKNDEAAVRAAFAHAEEEEEPVEGEDAGAGGGTRTTRRRRMPLSLTDHVVALEAGWGRKSDAIRRLAARLQLGLDAFVFVDDSAVECGEVAASLPEVAVVHLPPAAAHYPAFLRAHWAFDLCRPVSAWQGGKEDEGGLDGLLPPWTGGHGVGGDGGGGAGLSSPPPQAPLLLTDEDRARTRLYADNFARAESRGTHADFAAFLSSLGVRVTIAPLCPATVPRAAQLSMRTNQLNANKRPYTEAELEALLAAGTEPTAWTVHVADRFGSYGLVGLMVVVVGDSPPALDVRAFLLSCRVLQRGVEFEMLRHLGAVARDRGRAGGLRVRWVPSERNEPMRAFLWSLPQMRFDAAAEGAAGDEAGAGGDVFLRRALAGPRAALEEADAYLSDYVRRGLEAGDALVAAAVAGAARDAGGGGGAAAGGRGGGGVAAAQAPPPRRPCRFGLRCTRFGLDAAHLRLFSHDSLWDSERSDGRDEAGVAALGAVWRRTGTGTTGGGDGAPIITEEEAARLARAYLEMERARADRAFLGNIHGGAPRGERAAVAAATAAAQTMASSSSSAPVGGPGTVVIPLHAALSAEFDAGAVDAAAEAAANLLSGGGGGDGAKRGPEGVGPAPQAPFPSQALTAGAAATCGARGWADAAEALVLPVLRARLGEDAVVAEGAAGLGAEAARASWRREARRVVVERLGGGGAGRDSGTMPSV